MMARKRRGPRRSRPRLTTLRRTRRPRRPPPSANGRAREVRLIIAGGREHRDPTLVERAWLASPFSKNGPVSEIVTGGARGVDTLAFDWSHRVGLGWPRVFPADWKKHGRAAGPLRNEAMAAYAGEEPDGALLAIPGKGRGT